MYREIMHPNLILMIPLSPEDQRKVEYLDDTMSDGQWEVRDIGNDNAIACATVGGDQVMLDQYIHDSVVILFDALDTVTQDEADQYAREAGVFEVEEEVTIGPESARAMLARHQQDNWWTDETTLRLIADWLDEDEARLVSLSRFLNDTADTDREAAVEAAGGDDDDAE